MFKILDFHINSCEIELESYTDQEDISCYKRNDIVNGSYGGYNTVKGIKYCKYWIMHWSIITILDVGNLKKITSTVEVLSKFFEIFLEIFA